MQSAVTIEQDISLNANFRSLSATVLLSGIAAQVLQLLLPLLVLKFSESEFDVGAVRSVITLPNALLAAFIGVYVDRFGKRRTLVVSLMVQAVGLLVLCLFCNEHDYDLRAIIVCVFIIMTFQYTLGNASNASLKLVLPQSALPKGNAVIAGLQSLLTVAGPALAGIALMVMSIQSAVALSSSFAVLAVVVSLRLRLDERPIPRVSAASALREGIAVLRRNKVLLSMCVAMSVTNGTEGIYLSMLIVRLKAVLHQSDFSIGFIVSVSGLGAVIGASLFTKLRSYLGVGKTFCIPIIITSAVYMIGGSVYSLPGLILLSFLEGFCNISFALGMWTYRSESTDASLLGRVGGLTGSILKLCMPPMVLAGGYLAQKSSVSVAMTSAAGINLLMFMLCSRSRLWRAGFYKP